MRAIVALGLASFASQALVRAADTLLPQIAADFAISVGAASIVITAYALTHGSMQFVTGPIADRFGKFRTVAIACGLSAVTVAICGLAHSLDSLTLARFASGITVAWILPISLAFIGDVVPYDQRQQLLGRFLASQILGQLFGQAAGGIVGDYFGWRVMFFLLAAMLALAAIALGTEIATNPITRVDRTAPKGLGPLASYKIVLRNPWARVMLLTVGLEGALFQGVFPYISADLHLRFGLSFTARERAGLAFRAAGCARNRPRLLHAAQHATDRSHPDDAGGARHLGRTVRLDVFHRADGGRGARGAGDGPLWRAAAVCGFGRAAAGAGVLVHAST
jgi:MFS transporter, YNFM family, putative membrane transport protein